MLTFHPLNLLGFLFIFLNLASSDFVDYCINADACLFGVTLKTMDPTTEIECFLGFPYALPPIGENRFKRPKPFVFDTVPTYYMTLVERLPCMQYSYNFKEHPEGSEDCLNLNIYKPKGNVKDLNVLIEFTDRDFEYGDASSGVFGPELLMTFTNNKLIVVTVNTRMSIFGYYFNTDNNAPSEGNMGLWDHLMALEWVYNNIRVFGGDPQKITVAGEASVSYLILNKKAQAIIANCIIRYTTFISEYNRPWEAKYYGVIPQHTFDDTKEAYLRVLLDLRINNDTLNLAGPELLRLIYNEHRKYLAFPEFRFKPVVDAQFKIKDPFLWAHPVTLMGHPNHTFPKPIFILRVQVPAFDILTELLLTGYDEINAVDTDDTDLKRTQVSLFESLFFSSDWNSVISLIDIHALFYGIQYMDINKVRNLEVTKENADSLISILSSALFDYPLFKLINLRVPTLDGARPQTILIPFAHELYKIKSARSRFIPGESYYVDIPFWTGDQKELGPRGDDAVFMYTSTHYNKNPPGEYWDSFYHFINIVTIFVFSARNDNNLEKADIASCEIRGRYGSYDVDNCTLLEINMLSNDTVSETHTVKFENTPAFKPFLLWDLFFWGTLKGYNYTDRQVPTPEF